MIYDRKLIYKIGNQRNCKFQDIRLYQSIHKLIILSLMNKQVASERNLLTIESQTKQNQTQRHKNYRKKTLSNGKNSQKRNNTKSNSQSLIRPSDTENDRNKLSAISGALRSKMLSVHLLKPMEQNVKISSPYEKLAKQLNIKLPTPKQKFLQFLDIPPFNRLNNHLQFISHILQKNIQFFRNHPVNLVNNLARKIVKLDVNNVPNNFMVILDEGICYYNYKINGKSRSITKGTLIVRKNFDLNRFSYDSSAPLTLIGFHYHDYSSFISQYLNQNMEKFKNFLSNIQIFKIFHEQALQKIYASLTLHFFVKGQNLYAPGDEANCLFVIFSGQVARKIIVQLDKTNKIPLQGFSKLVKVLSRSYEHRIQFQKQDLVGVSQIVENIPTRSQKIAISEDATILAIDRNAIEQNLDEYIQDRLRKYNTRKYPKNYDQLCDNYLKQKMENRRTEQRKIAALKDEYNKNNNDKKTQKISNIIKIYQDRIRKQEKEHLIQHRKVERVMQNDN